MNALTGLAKSRTLRLVGGDSQGGATNTGTGLGPQEELVTLLMP